MRIPKIDQMPGLDNLTSSDDYLNWNTKYGRAISRARTGAALLFSGSLLLGVSMYLTFKYPVYKLFESNKPNALYLIGDTIGFISIITGSIISRLASGEKRALEEEGKQKGYISAGIFSHSESYGIFINVTF